MERPAPVMILHFLVPRQGGQRIGKLVNRKQAVSLLGRTFVCLSVIFTHVAPITRFMTLDALVNKGYETGLLRMTTPTC